jgi:hypothetical protein
MTVARCRRRASRYHELGDTFICMVRICGGWLLAGDSVGGSGAGWWQGTGGSYIYQELGDKFSWTVSIYPFGFILKCNVCSYLSR